MSDDLIDLLIEFEDRLIEWAKRNEEDFDEAMLKVEEWAVTSNFQAHRKPK